ncbi:TPA: hypothetical protein RJR39_003095 [Burkholderia cenocepacia]|uniref:hypothetical protein n=1 Tax=Burkholderia cenocepacia TaxID=95486 RepID=UPI001BA180D5|nr:hypothetical protein [Burkholderia cenocepacia]MBR8196041.1 hypothetical protein [Burkholderia cenocepacia]HDV6327014.1 hypothetical protein [Burkholderia cenocepacia]
MDTLIDDSSIVSNRVVSFWGRLGSRSADGLILAFVTAGYDGASPHAFMAPKCKNPRLFGRGFLA